MAHQEKKANSGVLEWRITLADGSSKSLVPAEEGSVSSRIWKWLKGSLAGGLALKVWKFLKKAWDLGLADPRKVIHGLKVGMALAVVSLFYFMRPLYVGVGGNAMWAIMTVVVVFENTVGATICKSLNRVLGTTLAGFLAFGVHWVAGRAGEEFEPLIVAVSVFLLASAATFSRFIPSVKARFDYGAMIFILTFSLVAVSGYRVDQLFNMAHHRISTIIIGTSLCILVTMIICPIWAGQELHVLISKNMEKLASSLDGCIEEYFDQNNELNDKQSEKKLHGYKCVLGSKGAEESMANFARWEPAHGSFNYKHPWNQYLKIGASMRSCACCIEALNSCVDSENQAPESIKKHLRNVCLKLKSNSSSVIKELAETIKTMKKSSTIDYLVEEMSSSVLDLQNETKSLSKMFNNIPPEEQGVPETAGKTSSGTVHFLEVIQVVTLASLLIEISSRIQNIVEEVQELANLAGFKDEVLDKSQQNHLPIVNRIVPSDNQQTVKASERV